MKHGSSTLPSITTIDAALRATTEALAHELGMPEGEPPNWTEFEWNIARAVSAMHGVSSLLDERSDWEGPATWRRFLREQSEHSVGRHVQIAGLLDTIDRQARRQGVTIVALKGAALYAKGIYATGERPMGDIDLLVCQEQTRAMARVLNDCGYDSAYSLQRHEVFQPRSARFPTGARLGEHVENPIKIEVHTRIAERLPVTKVDITQFVFPDTRDAGIGGYPTNASLMMHLLLHAAGNIRARALRLIQLQDVALLAARFTYSDWDELLAARPGGRALWWALSPLLLTERYFPSALPPGVYARSAAECPALLAGRARRQRLSDVSWSNIRISAFPGLEWSRNPREALAFMRSRIWPSVEARMELKEGAAQIPGSSTVPWYGISHGRRIARWLFTKPPRVQTLLSVRAALAQEHQGLNTGVSKLQS